MALFPTVVRKFLFGTPWGEIFPPKANPPPLAIDGRTAALRVLREYVTNLTFYRAAGPKPPIPFTISPDNFQIEAPDSTVDQTYPALAVVPSRANYDVIGLNSYIEEDTRDVFAPGTVVQWQAEYIETINLEINATKKAERRAILAGLETAFSPTEQMSGLRFKMSEYFNELVCFTLMRREIFAEQGDALNRRRAHLEMQMRFNIVALVNYVPLNPVVSVNVDVDSDSLTPLNFTPES